MGENTFVSIARRVNPIRDSNQADKYRVLVEKLIQMEAKDWSFSGASENPTLNRNSANRGSNSTKTNKKKSNEIIKELKEISSTSP